MDIKTCRLITWEGNIPEPGEYLKTNAGSVYLVLTVRLNTRPDPKSVAKLTVLKLTPSEIEDLSPTTSFHYFQWGTR